MITDREGWCDLVLVLDWYIKKVVGYTAGMLSTSADWLTALDGAVNRQFPHGVRDGGLSLRSDNGCQATSVAFMKACHQLGIVQAFTSYNNPKGNADTERQMRTLKEELVWLREWTSTRELQRALAAWVEWYNTRYLHSALGYRTPAPWNNNINSAIALSPQSLDKWGALHQLARKTL